MKRALYELHFDAANGGKPWFFVFSDDEATRFKSEYGSTEEADGRVLMKRIIAVDPSAPNIDAAEYINFGYDDIPEIAVSFGFVNQAAHPATP